MFLSRVQLFIVVITTHIILPVLLLLGLFLFGKGSLIGAIVCIFFVGNLIFLLFKIGNWEFTWYYLRYFYVLAFLIISFGNLIKLYMHVEIIYSINAFIEVGVFVLASGIMCLNINALRASIKPQNCLDLTFPFKNGKYIITDGGDGKISSLLNYHNKAQIHKTGQTNSSMRYATDIVKHNKYGFTVKNVLTDQNEQYEIFHEKVYSPCNATVIKVVEGIQNNIPFSFNFPYNVGNSVVLKVDSYYIVMGHFHPGSIIVKEGEQVKAEQQLGMIGNSGLTPRPHLHIQVSKCEDGFYWGGEGIPILFKNFQYPTKNRVFKVQ
jgi:hypothetical protein